MQTSTPLNSLAKDIIANELWGAPFEVLFDKSIRFKLFKGGRGGAKSQHLFRAAVTLAIQSPIRVLCVREINTSIKESVHQLLEDIIKEYQVKYQFDDFEILASSIKNKRNGSEFIFKGLKDLNLSASQAVKSYESVDLCIIEEGQTLTKRVIDVLIPTIRKAGSEIWAAMNELTPNDPLIEAWKVLPRAIIKHVNYYDNPFLPKELLEVALACKKAKPSEYKTVWLGIPARDAIPYVVPYFTKDNIIPPGVYYNDRPLYLSCDFNVDPMMWVVVQHINGKSFYIDEIVRENTTTQECISIFAEKYKDHKTPIIINGDASGKNRSTQSKDDNFKIMVNYLTKVGLTPVTKLLRSNPRIPDRIASFNDRVLNISAKRMNDNTIKSLVERRIFVTRNCKYLIKNLKELQFWPGTSDIKTPNRYELKSDPELKFMGHIFDAASYHEHFYYPIKKQMKKEEKVTNISTSKVIKASFDRAFPTQRGFA